MTNIKSILRGNFAHCALREAAFPHEATQLALSVGGDPAPYSRDEIVAELGSGAADVLDVIRNAVKRYYDLVEALK